MRLFKDTPVNAAFTSRVLLRVHSESRAFCATHLAYCSARKRLLKSFPADSFLVRQLYARSYKEMIHEKTHMFDSQHSINAF
jgi:hypothetical protein